ncbi:hypothetical protein GCM10027073_08490 [Streptomyces chlorus]
MIVLGWWRGFLRGAAPGLEVRQEAVVKEAAHRPPSLGRPTDNLRPPREHPRIPATAAAPRPVTGRISTLEDHTLTLGDVTKKVTKMYRAYHPSTFTRGT